MVKLTSNEEKVGKELRKFPQGIKVTQLVTALGMSKTVVYRALDELRECELAFQKPENPGLWFPEKHQDDRIENKHEDDRIENPRLQAAVRYFQWRGTPEGGDNRFWRSMFPKPEKEKE